MSNFKNSEKIKTIAYLGKSGSFTEIAKDYFCEKYNLNAYQMPFRTIKEIISYVESDQDSVGIIPVENAKEGIIRETNDTLISSTNENIKILSDTILPANNCLLSKNSEIYNITGLIAPAPAIARCNEYIKTELPIHLNIINTTDTEEAARLLNSYNLTYAIIGTEKTAEIYNLNILNNNINNDKDNYTKFIMIGNFDTEPTEHSTSSVALSLGDVPGLLFKVVKEFAEKNINITYVHATPSKLEEDQYILFLDFEGHIKEPHVCEAIENIKKHTNYFRFMGSYERI
ncbi:MAG: ACT domain-containing protein [Cyanobacteria bacterium RUI128]|nr:ACT domain-containing protein [Cyanobacteria bacterium RUI128]